MLPRQKDPSETQAEDAPLAQANPNGVQDLVITSIGDRDKEPHHPTSHPGLQLLRHGSTGSYAESHSTAPSSYVDSPGPNSPASTAYTSTFLLDGEDQPEQPADEEDVRNYSLPFSTTKDLRSRPPLARASSLDAEKERAVRRNSASEKAPHIHMPKHLRRSREDVSPKRSHHTFPFRTATGWATPNSPVSASAPGSRRDSTQSVQSSHHKSKLRESELIYDTDKVGPSDEPESLIGKEIREEPMGESSVGSAADKISRAFLDESSSEGMDDGPDDPRTPETSATADSSNSMSDLDTPLPQRPCQNQTEDVCERVLREYFSLELQDLPLAVDALESTTHFLEELANIVCASRHLQFNLPIRELTPSTGSNSRSGQPIGNESNGAGGIGANQNRKRPSNNHHRNRNGKDPEDQEGESGEDHEGDDGSPGANNKRRKTDGREARYSCPFRKRNPRKFNVRSHTTCATTHFTDISSLKRHVKIYHKRSQNTCVCFRCHQTFPSGDDLVFHLQLPAGQMCDVRPKVVENDPEEGITDHVVELLNQRKSSTKIDSWETLWRALFEDEDPLPQDFEPPVELHEVQHVFEETREQDLNSRVRTECQSISDLSLEVRADLANRMGEGLWSYIKMVMATSRLHVEGGPRRRRRSQQSNGTSQSPPSGQQYGLMPRPIQPKPAAISQESSLSSSWETAHMGSPCELTRPRDQRMDGTDENTSNERLSAAKPQRTEQLLLVVVSNETAGPGANKFQGRDSGIAGMPSATATSNAVDPNPFELIEAIQFDEGDDVKRFVDP